MVVCRNDYVIDVLVEFFNDVYAGIDGQLGIQDASLDPKLLEEELEPIASIRIANEDDAFAFDEFQFEYNVG